MQDLDSDVKDAVAVAVGSLAAGLQSVTGGAGAGDAPSNNVLKIIFEGMNDFDHGSQQTAAAALMQARSSSPMFHGLSCNSFYWGHAKKHSD